MRYRERFLEPQELGNRDASAAIDVQERDVIVEREEEIVGSRIGSLNEIPIAVRFTIGRFVVNRSDVVVDSLGILD